MLISVLRTILLCPAEYRSYRAMEFEPQSSEDMNRQLRLIYSQLMIMMNGAPTFRWLQDQG